MCAVRRNCCCSITDPAHCRGLEELACSCSREVLFVDSAEYMFRMQVAEMACSVSIVCVRAIWGGGVEGYVCVCIRKSVTGHTLQAIRTREYTHLSQVRCLGENRKRSRALALKRSKDVRLQKAHTHTYTHTHRQTHTHRHTHKGNEFQGTHSTCGNRSRGNNTAGALL